MVKKVDMLKVRKLIWSDVSSNRIATLSDMSRQAISKYREGEIDIENMKISTAIKLVEVYDELLEKGELK